MRGKYYDKKIKRKAKLLRLEGKTYKEIKDQLSIPKSTLSTWFSAKIKTPFNKKAQLIHLRKIRPLAIEAKKRKKENELKELQDKINREINFFPFKNIGFHKAMLAMLYWAEGSKHDRVSGLKFANTDPRLAKLYIALLRKCFKIDESKFRIRVHIHYYHKKTVVKEFWSDLLNIPQAQFTSIYVKKRSRKKRFRKNFMGICLINYLDSQLRKEILETAFKIQKIICQDKSP